MIRTSIVLTPALHQQLSLLARQEGKKLSEFVREQLGRMVVEDRQTQINRMYANIQKMRGMIKDNVTDASITINEVLYGNKGSSADDIDNIGLWELPDFRHDKRN
jgi:hypothetical protein